MTTAPNSAENPDFASEPTEDSAELFRAASVPPSIDLGPEPMPRFIGPYKILQVIGEGGFGVVYMGEQTEPVRRRVAVKVIKLGMDTRQVIARFEAERQALALMEHPHIARVLDAGATESGRPYFVMEYVKGSSITAFARSRGLTLRERLDLFQQVCLAVQHAHTKGVIHRDIKPGNVLVSMTDGKPFARVIDFGIAKATSAPLTQRTLFTEHHQLIGTPEYMSPEQAEGSPDIDTRTDVYALGVLLYELLTGLTPFDGRRLRSAAFAEMRRIIREEDPPAPSVRATQRLRQSHSPLEPRASASGLPEIPAGAGFQRAPTNPSDPNGTDPSPETIRGELDWIAMKALDKDRARRYATPGDFAADVGRHLGGEAVEAAPASKAYLARKFLRKHRGPVAAVGAVIVALALGGAVSAWLLFESRALTAQLAAQYREYREQVQRTRLAEATVTVDSFDFNENNYEPTPEQLDRARGAYEARAEYLGQEDPETTSALYTLGMLEYFTWWDEKSTRIEPPFETLRQAAERRIESDAPWTVKDLNMLTVIAMYEAESGYIENAARLCGVVSSKVFGVLKRFGTEAALSVYVTPFGPGGRYREFYWAPGTNARPPASPFDPEWVAKDGWEVPQTSDVAMASWRSLFYRSNWYGTGVPSGPRSVRSRTIVSDRLLAFDPSVWPKYWAVRILLCLEVGDTELASQIANWRLAVAEPMEQGVMFAAIGLCQARSGDMDSACDSLLIARGIDAAWQRDRELQRAVMDWAYSDFVNRAAGTLGVMPLR